MNGDDLDCLEMNIIRCEETMAKLEERKEKLLAETNLGVRFRERTFENFDRKKNPQAYDKAFGYAKDFDAHSGNGLILMGTVGTGKTHLAAAITHYLAERGIGVKFGNIVDLFEDLRNSYNTDDDILLDLKRVPLLVIDDLGKERKTEWTQEQIYAIVNYRYEHNLPLVITTNCTVKELNTRLGDATMSRIREMCEPVKVVGEDVRKEKK